MSYSNNLYFKHVLNIDYPMHKLHMTKTTKQIDYWTSNATHIISGCEWVDYMYAWDTLMLAHFSINIDEKSPIYKPKKDKGLKILHAPNHRAIKGSEHLVQSVSELRDEGYEIELILLTGVSNSEVLAAIETVDIVADQFVIGWYAMFALEAMAKGKPVLCYLREDLIDLYTKANLIEKGEIPIINTEILNIKDKLIWAYENKDELFELGEKSRSYVKKHHSLESVGKVFDKINKSVLKEV